MTASRTEQVLTAIVATLTGATDAGAKVYRERVEPVVRSECPVIIVAIEQEDQNPDYSTCRTRNELQVMVMVCTRGDAVSKASDTIRCQAHAALYADQTLGGLATGIKQAGCRWSPAAGDNEPGVTMQSYRVAFFTLNNDLTN